MFDNFVISCEDDKCAAEPVVPEPEETEPELTPSPEELVAEVAEEEIPVISEPEEEPEPEEEVVSYTQDELDAEVKKAEERGYEKGFQNAVGEFERQQLSLLAELNTRLMTALADNENRLEQQEQESMRFALEVVRKILPGLEKETALNEINRFLSVNFPNFRREASLSLPLIPKLSPRCRKLLPNWQTPTTLKGKFLCIKMLPWHPATAVSNGKTAALSAAAIKCLKKSTIY
ncbi:MAG: hypothetical protein ACLU99_03420 [Alphaproteobacteria bacterium]